MNPKQNGVTRTAMLAGTALALVLGGAVFGSQLEFTRTQPAFAQVQVQGVEPASFADVVDQVRPAVVSVRVQSTSPQTSSLDDFQFFDLPPGSPMERFFRQFRQDNPQAQPEQRQGQTDQSDNVARPRPPPGDGTG